MSGSESDDSSDDHVELEVKEKGVGRRKPPTTMREGEGLDKPRKRVMTAAALEKLAHARARALAVRKEKAAAKNIGLKNEKELKKEKDKGKPLKPPKEADPPSEEPAPTPRRGEGGVPPVKKKKPKKPIVIVEQESSDSSDDQVIYLQRPRARRRRYYDDDPKKVQLTEPTSVHFDAPKGEPLKPPSAPEAPPPPPQKTPQELALDLQYMNMFGTAPSRRRR